MFFLAGPGGGWGGWGPRQGHVPLSRQRPADRLVTELGHSASASQAVGVGEGLPLCGLTGAGATLFSFFRWVTCVGVWHRESRLGSGIGPGGGGGQA